MDNQYDNINEDERLSMENDFLKMKLMLEQGAEFGSMSNEKLPTEIENEFLNYIIAFEKQAEERKMIKVFDKIERPQHFKQVNEIIDSEIPEALQVLQSYMNGYGINFDVCSPNISDRELYRFIIEELFDYEMNDMNIPGMQTNFIYDEFHPDDVYENTNAAVNDCIKIFFKKDPVTWMPHFKEDNLRLNNNCDLNNIQFLEIVNQFKVAYDTIELTELPAPDCKIIDKSCFVSGTYTLSLGIPKEIIFLAGTWMVELELDEELGYWYINNVQIEGINFQ